MPWENNPQGHYRYHGPQQWCECEASAKSYQGDAELGSETEPRCELDELGVVRAGDTPRLKALLHYG